MSDSDAVVLVEVDPPFQQQVDHAGVERAVQEAIKTAAGAKGTPGIFILPPPTSWDRIEVSVRVMDDVEMHRLNLKYRGVDRPTDVLSFSFVDEHDAPWVRLAPDMPLQLGEIAVSYPYVVKQAEELGHSEEMELSWLLIHGTLQLLGYTHDTGEAAQRMEELEQKALRALGFEVP
jgi:probable rRNA maturation factor